MHLGKTFDMGSECSVGQLSRQTGDRICQMYSDGLKSHLPNGEAALPNGLPLQLNQRNVPVIFGNADESSV
jgi:hypothetical protein